MTPRYIKLFQYGSNMNPARLNSEERLQGAAVVIGMARLWGWGIRFDLYSGGNNRCGVTDMVQRPQEHVDGVLYEVPYRLVVASRGQRSRMDVIEGAGLGRDSNYLQRKVLVSIKGGTVEARTYVGTAAGRDRFLRCPVEDRRVSRDYFAHVLRGARLFRLSAKYISYLRRQAGLR